MFPRNNISIVKWIGNIHLTPGYGHAVIKHILISYNSGELRIHLGTGTGFEFLVAGWLL